MFFFNYRDTEINFKSRSIEHAYLAILNDDLKTAGAVFESIESPRAHWGKTLTDILNGYLERYPTYFEIRNFYEIDLDFLIKNEKFSYVEQLLGALELLSTINQESYKYAARVMYENKLYKAALKYMEKSQQIFYKDPELHFMYAKYYYNDRDYINADFHIEECLKIIPEYFPAKEFKKTLSRYLA